MYKNKVWDFVDFPLDRKPIGNTWVLRIKPKCEGTIYIYKAILVVKGYNQKERIMEIDSHHLREGLPFILFYQ